MDRFLEFPNEIGNKQKTQKACPKGCGGPLYVEFWGEEGEDKILIRITCGNSVFKKCKYEPNTKPEFKSALEKSDYAPVLAFMRREGK